MTLGCFSVCNCDDQSCLHIFLRIQKHDLLYTHIFSHETRSIARQRKHLIDYKAVYKKVSLSILKS